MNPLWESVKERHIPALFDKKMQMEQKGVYNEIKRGENGFIAEDCDLCGASNDDILKQSRLDFSK